MTQETKSNRYIIQIPSNAVDHLMVNASSPEEAKEKFMQGIDVTFVKTIECDVVEKGAAQYSEDAVSKLTILDSEWNEVG